MEEDFRRDAEMLIAARRRFRLGADRWLNRELAGTGVSLPQYTLMAVLDEMGESSMGELAGEMCTTMSAVTNLVRRLCYAGCVERGREPGDRRIVKVVLTARGRGVVERVVADAADYVARYFSRISPQERRTVLEVQRKLGDLLHEWSSEGTRTAGGTRKDEASVASDAATPSRGRRGPAGRTAGEGQNPALTGEDVLRDSRTFVHLRRRFRLGLTRWVNRTLPEMGFSQAQCTVMALLEETGEAAMGELSEKLGTSLAAATSLVDKLVRSGHVERRQSVEDRRVVRVVLTPEGQRVLRLIADKGLELAERFLGRIPEGDRKTYVESYQGMTELIEREVGEGEHPSAGRS